MDRILVGNLHYNDRRKFRILKVSKKQLFEDLEPTKRM